MYIDTYVSNFLKRMAIHFCETWFKNNCLLHKVEAGAGLRLQPKMRGSGRLWLLIRFVENLGLLNFPAS